MSNNTNFYGDNVIDSRDIIERIEELKDELETHLSDNDIDGSLESHLDDDSKFEGLESELHEYKLLTELANECDGYSDWRYGETLINSDYWVEYVEELLQECGDLPHNIPNYIVIDWDATAKNIAQDYTTVDLDGETFYIRNC